MEAPIRHAPRPPRAVTAVFVVVLVVTAAGCGWLSGPPGFAGPTASPASPAPTPTTSPGPTVTPAPPGPLLSVETRGGHCIGGTCGSIVILDTDGTVRVGGAAQSEIGTVPPEDVTGLAGLIAATDFDGLRSHPFTGTCPVAFDGQEVVYEFTTAGGIERIESCTTAVDPDRPLFAAVAGVLEDFISLPVE